MQAKIVHQFKVGDEIPEWLVYRKQRDAESTSGPLTFQNDGCIVEFESCFVVIAPENKGVGIILVGDGNHKMDFGAASKTVMVPALHSYFQMNGKPE